MRDRHRRLIIKTIAIIQVGFGSAGLLLAARTVFLLARRGAPLGATFALDIVLPFALSIAAGLLLRRGGVLGEVLSITNLGLQVPIILTSAFTFYYTAGLSLEVWFGSQGMGFNGYLGNRVRVGVDQNLPLSWIGINVVALTLLVLLVIALPGDSKSVELHSA
jgi:hypothetical protein